jgi:DNA-binding CsgD family transcriptional regulator
VKGISMDASTHRPAIIVVDTALRLLACNADAVQVLTFPKKPERIPDLYKWISHCIRSRLIDRRWENEHNVINTFKSAKRIYTCHSFPLTLQGGAVPPESLATLILLQRSASPAKTLNGVAEEFGLTPREGETVRLLLHGLTSKEIAESMKISLSTVKAFIRLVMIKMNVSTRSAIVGKVAEAQGWHNSSVDSKRKPRANRAVPQ